MVIAAILLALLGQGDDVLEPVLKTFNEAYKSPLAKTRAEAVAEMGKTSHPVVATRLLRILQSDEPEVRIAAARALGGFTDHKPKAAAALLAALAVVVKLDGVRAAVLDGLGALGERVAVPAVAKAVTDRKTPVAAAAARAAQALGGPECVEALIDSFRDVWSRIDSFETAKKIGKASSGPPEPDLVRAWDLEPGVRKALEAATGKKFGTPVEWTAWWKVNRATFRGP